METNEMVLNIMSDLRVSDARTVGEILCTVKEFKNPHSARVQAQKELNLLSEIKQLVRGSGWYALPSYKGEFKQHDRLLTGALAEILKLNYKCQIHREVAFEPALRSDAAILLKRGDDGLCFILEVVHNETPQYLQMKIEVWRNWKNAYQALSQLFGYKIKNFSLVTYTPDSDSQFNHLIKMLKGGSL